jgi:hypothetical protein
MEHAPYYKLIGHEVVPEHSFKAYREWWSSADRVVACTELPEHIVSTVFVGLGRLWFETTVLSSDLGDTWSAHSWSWEEALAKHQEAIEYAESELVA